jgi:hypothetical protein
MKSGKEKAMMRANKSLQERIQTEQGILKEDTEVGTPVILFDGKKRGTIVGYVVRLVDTGEEVRVKQGQFYNNTDGPNDDLPF